MFAYGKLDIFASQNRYNSVSQNFDMLPNGNKFDINPLSPRRAYRAHQRISRATHISKIPSGIYIAAAFSRCQLIGIMSIVL